MKKYLLPVGVVVALFLIAFALLGGTTPGNQIKNPDLSGGAGTLPPAYVTLPGPCDLRYLKENNTSDVSRCWESVVNNSAQGGPDAASLVNPGTLTVPVANEGKSFPITYAAYAANGYITNTSPDGSMGTTTRTINFVVPRVMLTKGPSGAVNPVATPTRDVTLYPGERLFDGSEGHPNPTSTRPYKWYIETTPGSKSYRLDPNCVTDKWCDHVFPAYGNYGYWLTVPYDGGYSSEDCLPNLNACTRNRGVITVAQAVPTLTPTPTPVVITGVITLYFSNGTEVTCDNFWNGCPTVGQQMYAKATTDGTTPISLGVNWNFGSGAVPSTSFGSTSPSFYYTTTGPKNISFSTSDPNTRATFYLQQVLNAVGPIPTSTPTPTPTATPTATPTPTPTPGANTPPTIVNFNVSDTNPTVNSFVTFNCTSTGNPTPTNTINFGDGTANYVGTSTTHTYTNTGVFSASCIANNGNPPESQRLLGITVKPVNQPSKWILPSSANAPGANGAYYTTQLSIGNWSSGISSVDLKFLGNNQDGTGGPVVTKIIPINSSYDDSNILLSAFNITSGFGAIQITANTPQLNITSQTSTPIVGGGSVGQSVPAIPYSSFINYGSPKTLISLREDSAFRTNLVLANTGLSPITVKGVLYSSSGAVLGTGTWNLPALGMIQVGRVITNIVPGLVLTNGTIQLSTTTPGGSFVSYASVIDNITNDPRTILPQ